MKNLKLIGFLMIFASSLMFIQCTSDPIAGPQGIAGADGANGTDGADGVDGNTACLQCHGQEVGSFSKIDNALASYNASGHAAGGAVGYAGSRGSCSECHSNEGYVNKWTGMDAVDIAFPTAISCKTCHDIHDPEKIAQGSTDFNLRNVAGTTLKVNSDITIDYGNTSNACISCHQPRKVSGLAGLADDATFNAPSHWGPHHGPQSTLLEGIQGEEFVGSLTYSTEQHPHRAGASCVSCHMGETEKGKGGHSWKPNLNNCTVCHTDGAPEMIFGFKEKMDELEAELVLRNVLLGEPGAYHVNEDDDMTVLEARAAWNWLFITEDSSNGIHNPPYSKALIQNSIEALQP